jgi:hypothetical protein
MANETPNTAAAVAPVAEQSSAGKVESNGASTNEGGEVVAPLVDRKRVNPQDEENETEQPATKRQKGVAPIKAESAIPSPARPQTMLLKS